MARRLLPWLAVFACILMVAAGPPASPPASLVRFDDLEKRLANPGPTLRLLDVRPRADFDKGHIPGAIWVDVRAASALAAQPTGLTDIDAWTAWLAPLAIGPDSDVLVYGDDRQLSAARVWWLLKYLGVAKVGLIDGNYALWASEGRPVSTDLTQVEPRPFRVTFQADRRATRHEVLAALEDHSAQVIDARSEPEHTGAEAKARRGGHIPTACHLEWTEFVNPDGRFFDEPALRARVARAGLRPGESVITHCQSGGRASVDSFVFDRLGHPARTYYLGWSDWGNADETPVTKGKEDGKAKP